MDTHPETSMSGSAASADVRLAARHVCCTQLMVRHKASHGQVSYVPTNRTVLRYHH